LEQPTEKRDSSGLLSLWSRYRCYKHGVVELLINETCFGYTQDWVTEVSEALKNFLESYRIMFPTYSLYIHFFKAYKFICFHNFSDKSILEENPTKPKPPKKPQTSKCLI